MNRRRDLEPLASALPEVLRQHQPATGLARIQSAWPEVAGAKLAEWATPVSESGGVVVFECSDSMVAHELEMLKDELLRKFAETLKEGAPNDLRFRAR